MSGPFDAPQGSTPTTYRVTITTVVPQSNTDPADWDFETLLEHIRDHYWSEVDSVPAEWSQPAAAPEPQPEPPAARSTARVGEGRPSRLRETDRTCQLISGEHPVHELEYQYGTSYGQAAKRLGLGTLCDQRMGAVWLTLEERQAVYDQWCAGKNSQQVVEVGHG